MKIIIQAGDHKKRIKKEALVDQEAIEIMIDQVVQMVDEWKDNLDAAFQEVFEFSGIDPGMLKSIKMKVEQKVDMLETQENMGRDMSSLDPNMDFTERGF
jgi:hypothetical protein